MQAKTACFLSAESHLRYGYAAPAKRLLGVFSLLRRCGSDDDNYIGKKEGSD